MKRYIRAAAGDVIMKSDDGLFEVIERQGVGMAKTPWKGLTVKSYGDAYKYVVEVRLHQFGNPDFNGEPVDLKYDDVEVAHGMSMREETLEDTERYIEVLQSALDLAKKIKDSDILVKG